MVALPGDTPFMQLGFGHMPVQPRGRDQTESTTRTEPICSSDCIPVVGGLIVLLALLSGMLMLLLAHGQCRCYCCCPLVHAAASIMRDAHCRQGQRERTHALAQQKLKAAAAKEAIEQKRQVVWVPAHPLLHMIIVLPYRHTCNYVRNCGFSLLYLHSITSLNILYQNVCLPSHPLQRGWILVNPRLHVKHCTVLIKCSPGHSLLLMPTLWLVPIKPWLTYPHSGLSRLSPG